MRTDIKPPEDSDIG